MFSYKHVHVFRQSFDNRPCASPESIPARHIVYLITGGRLEQIWICDARRLVCQCPLGKRIHKSAGGNAEIFRKATGEIFRVVKADRIRDF